MYSESSWAPVDFSFDTTKSNVLHPVRLLSLDLVRPVRSYLMSVICLRSHFAQDFT